MRSMRIIKAEGKRGVEKTAAGAGPGEKDPFSINLRGTSKI